MNNNHNINTFLLINNKKIFICVYDVQNSKNIYFERKKNETILNEFFFSSISRNNLDKNVFKIEKLIKTFIKNINLILESEKFITIQISLKKNINGDNLKKRFSLFT